jgi:hypothetical protein
MPPPRAPGYGTRRRQRQTGQRVQRFAGLALVGAVLVVTLVLTAFGSVRSQAPVASVADPATARLAPSGPPRPQIVAVHDRVRIQLPVPQSRLTAIGYHGASDGDALALEPLGRRGNQGLLGRVADRIFGPDRAGLVWYQLGGGLGHATSAIDVGAPPDTDVFAPVDGTVVGMSNFVLNQTVYGVRVDIQPTSAPALVVRVSRLSPDPVLTVGSAVVAAKTRLGTVIDLADVEEQALAGFTQDAGNHVTIQVRPAANFALP